MVWFRVDDKFHRGKKVRRLGSEPVTAMARVAAVGLWTLCGDWASDELTDGFVPWPEVEKWDPERSLAKRLIDVDLCHEDQQDGESGIQFHDWQDWNPTKAEIAKKRADQARRVQRWRERHGYAKPDDASGNALPNTSPDASQDMSDVEAGAGNALPNAWAGIPPNPNPNPKNLSETASQSSSDADERSSSKIDLLVERLTTRMRENDFRVPGSFETWRRQARLMLDRDKREFDQALRLIDWATKHSFWHANIRSMGTFREKYDTLLAQARQEQRPSAAAPQRPNRDDRVREALKLAERLEADERRAIE